jgi:peptidoglycan/LPS O-acetylase OafA/YrhL
MVQSALGYEHVDGVYWTLEVQLIFYAWVFLICLIRQKHHTGRFLGAWLAAAVCINLFGGLTFTKLDYLLLPRLSFYFIAGSAFFLIHQSGRRSLYLWSIVAVCYLMSVRLAMLDPRHGNATAALVGHTLLFLLFARMVLHDHRLAGKPWMVTLFKMTYPLYLMHQSIGYVLLTRSKGFLPKYVSLLLVIAFMLTASYVIATQIDKWVMPSFKRATDRMLALLGERPAEARARHATAHAAANGKIAPGEGPEQAPLASAEVLRQEAG